MTTQLFLFYRKSASQANLWRLITIVVGILGLVSVFVLQTLLVLKLITTWQQSYFIVAAFGAIGVWMIAASWIGHAENLISSGLARFGIAIGIGWLLANLLIWLGGFPPADSVSSFSDMSQLNKMTSRDSC